MYYLLWLAAGLLIIAILSAAITWRIRSQVARRLKAAQLIDALADYSGWVAAQRRLTMMLANEQDAHARLEALRGFWQPGFPELAVEFAEISVVHERLLQLLRDQQALRLKDPEAWLEYDYDALYAQLWRQHLAAVHAAVLKVQRAVGVKAAATATHTWAA